MFLPMVGRNGLPAAVCQTSTNLESMDMLERQRFRVGLFGRLSGFSLGGQERIECKIRYCSAQPISRVWAEKRVAVVS